MRRSSKTKRRAGAPGPDSGRARDVLVERWRPDALRFARVIARGGRIALPDDELESQAMWGLLRAIDGFDPSRGARFSTYLYHKVRGAVLDHVRDACYRADRTRLRFHSLEKLDEMLDDAAEHSSSGDSERGARLTQLGLSAATGSTSRRLMESDGRAASPEAHERWEIIALAMRALNHRPTLRNIVKMYFFGGHTLEEIGNRLGFSSANASQQLRRALHEMRRDLDALGIGEEDAL